MTEVRYCRTKLGEEERERMDQRITTAEGKIRRYSQRNLQYHQNNMFRNDQRQFYKGRDGKMNGQTKESTEFWRKLLSEPVVHNRDSEWLKKATFTGVCKC